LIRAYFSLQIRSKDYFCNQRKLLWHPVWTTGVQPKMNEMKKLLSILLISASTFAAFGQNKNVTSAYMSMKDGEYGEAREFIDLAIEHEKTMGDEKTWRYRGDIYFGIAQSDEDYGVAKADAVSKALESYLKAKELDEKERYLDKTQNGIALTQNLALNMGIQMYNEKKFEDSRDLFLLAAEGAEKMGVVDTLAIYNAGLAAEQAEDYETAIREYRKAAETGYNGANMYLYIANLYSKQDMDEKYISVIQEGRKEYPENADLILYELNYYLVNQKFDEAKENLLLALEKDPDNKQLHFSLGVVYDNLGVKDGAVAAYKKAIELDPNYFDAVYNLGAFYFNEGVEVINVANEIEAQKEYEAKIAEAEEVFKQAQPYLEKAHELDPQDRGAIVSLQQLYARTGAIEKATEMKKKLEGTE